MGCVVHGDFRTEGDVCKPCNQLPIGTTLNDKNIYGEVYAVKKQRFDKMISKILECYDEIDSVELMYQCDFEKDLHTPGTDIYNFFNSSDTEVTPKTKPPPPMRPRNGLRGGTVESYSMVATSSDTHGVYYIDINRYAIH